MDRGGPREEGGRGRREEEKTGETRVENWRDEARREGQNEANGVNLPGCRGSPSPPGPPRAPCSFSFLSFCYVEPAAFPAIRSIRPLSLLFEIELQEVERRCLLDAPDSSDKMQVNSLSLFLSVYRRKDQASRPGSRSFFLDFFEYFSTAFSVNLA